MMVRAEKMDGEINQLASAMLVLVFAAVVLVAGLLYIEPPHPFAGVAGPAVVTVANRPLPAPN
jgi:hypothetical protein